MVGKYVDMDIAVTGSTGFIGSYLISHLDKVIPIYRTDFEKGIIYHKIQQADVVINLAGAPILKRWSNKYKKELEKSRIETTRQVVNAVNNAKTKHLISASAIGIYPENKACSEDCSESADDFLANLVKKWEREAQKCRKDVTILRLGVVLGKEGGALKKMLTAFRLGLGGPVKDGSMIMSWIALSDVARIIEFIIQKKETGIFNVTSPNPVTNKDFSKILGQVLNRPAFLPVPEFILKVLYGEAVSVLVSSREVYPARLLKADFIFEYPEIHQALKAMLM